jgi:TRAP-type C4-dicarboxylate transport system substrate-binding protein
MHLNRRTFVLGAAAAGVAAPWIARAAEPEFRLKFGNIVSADHPLNTSMAKAGERITKETDGRVTIELFPKNQLGSDADMLSQLRSGALELFAQTGVLMSTLVPVASINGVGFAYPTYDKVWESLDGPLGNHIRKAFSSVNLVCLEKSWNHGFRQVTSSTKPILTPDDLSGFKIRVPRARCGRQCSKRSAQRRSPFRGRKPILPCRPTSRTALSSLSLGYSSTRCTKSRSTAR